MTDGALAQRRTSFGIAATDYAAGRPHYPREALAWVLPAGARRVLDLGAGTGILSQDLLDAGLDVVAAEPLPEMRALIPPAAQRLAGTAEAIPLADATVDAVAVGQAWHWFDAERAVPEVHRVLRPGGRAAVMWNLLDTSDPTTRTIADILEAEERADLMFDNPDPQPPFTAPELFTTPERQIVPHLQGYDRDRIVGYAVSRSQVILLDDDAREALIERLRAAVPAEPFPVHLVCEAWRATAV
jgi:SAM-dependent methyltransferase